MYKVTVYFNTGFDKINIPSSPSVLDMAVSKTYDADYYLRQDVDLSQIKINDTYDNLADVDFAKIYNESTGRTTYFLCIPTALAKNTTLLTLETSALLSLGGPANIEYESGLEIRGTISKSEDKLFDNTASEDWSPSKPLVATPLVEVKAPGKMGQTPLHIVTTTIDMAPLAKTSTTTCDVIDGITSGSTDAVMYWPKITANKASTIFGMYDFNDGSEKGVHVAGTMAYNADKKYIKNALDKIYSAGQLQLQSSYLLPKEWVYAAVEPGGTNNDSTFLGDVAGYTFITGNSATKEIKSNPFVYTNGYSPKNKKCYSMFRSYNLLNMASGDTSSMSPDELYDPKKNPHYPDVIEWADPTPNGKPMARFRYIKSCPNKMSNVVSGSQWNSAQVCMEGASGSMWNALSYSYNNQSISRSQELSKYNRDVANTKINNNMTMYSAKAALGATGSAVNIATGGLLNREGQFTTGGIANAAIDAGNSVLDYQNAYNNSVIDENANNARNSFDFAASQQEQNENATNLIKNNSIVAPSVMFTPSVTLGLYGYNKFYVYEVRLDTEDLESLDLYFQRYGYNGLDKPLTSQCFKERPYFNYVQAADVSIKSTWGLRIRQKAAAELNGGVRAWNVLPDSKYYSIN